MKHFTFNLKWLVMSLLLGVSVGAAAQTTGTITFGSKNVKIDKASVTANDSQSNSWTITTEGTTSFTSNANYEQVGSKGSPATSITFTTTLSEEVNITAFSAKFGGFSGTKGTITLKVGDTTVGTGSLDATNDVTVSSSSSQVGKVLTITITGIDKGVKCYYISYTYSTVSSTPACVTDLTLSPTSISITSGNTSATGQFTHSQTVADGATVSYSFSTTAESGLTFDAAGNYTATAEGTYKVKVTATPSDADAFSVVEKEVDVVVSDERAAVIGDLSISPSAVSVGDDGEFTFTPSDLAAGLTASDIEYDAVSSDDATLLVAGDMYEALKAGTVTVTVTASKAGYKPFVKELTVTVAKVKPVGAVFYESFDNSSAGTGGNDNTWDSSSSGSTKFDPDNSGWSFENGGTSTNGGSKECIKVGAGKSAGTATTPSISVTSGRTYTLTFVAAPWNAEASTSMKVEVAGGTIEGLSTSAMTAKQWNEYTATITATSSSIQLTFSASQNRFFLDEVLLVANPVTVEIGAAGYATYVAPCDVEFLGDVKGYIVSSTANGYATLEQIYTAPAGAAVIVQADAAGTYTLDLADELVDWEGTNLLQASDGTVEGDGSIYVLAQPAGEEVGFYLLEEGETLPAGKAYLEVAAGAKAFIGFRFGEANAIEGVTTADAQNAGRIYNLSGQQMKSLQKGLNIVNGKKVFIK